MPLLETARLKLAVALMFFCSVAFVLTLRHQCPLLTKMCKSPHDGIVNTSLPLEVLLLPTYTSKARSL